MTDTTKVEALYRRLVDRRRAMVETMAEANALPPTNALACLADLDSAIVAVEAVLEEKTGLQAAADHVTFGETSDALA